MTCPKDKLGVCWHVLCIHGYVGWVTIHVCKWVNTGEQSRHSFLWPTPIPFFLHLFLWHWSTFLTLIWGLKFYYDLKLQCGQSQLSADQCRATHSSDSRSFISLFLSRKQPSECMLSSTSGSMSSADGRLRIATFLGTGCSGSGSFFPPLTKSTKYIVVLINYPRIDMAVAYDVHEKLWDRPTLLLVF